VSPDIANGSSDSFSSVYSYQYNTVDPVKSHLIFTGNTGQQLFILDYHFIIYFLSTVSEFR